MNTEKIGNLLRVIAVILIAVIALFLIGATTANGLISENPDNQDKTNDDTSNGDNNQDTTNDQTSGDESLPPDTTGDENNKTEEQKPTYVSSLTGLTITEEEYRAECYALIYSPKDALYGISSASVLVEIPTSSNETRYAVYITSPEKLGKIGTLAPARDYILALGNTFGGIFVANGKDGNIKYVSSGVSLHIDLTQDTDYSYNESVENTYTSGSLLKEYIKDNKLDTSDITRPILPFLFSEEDYLGKASCNIMTLPFSESLSTSLVFDKTSCKYKLLRLGKEQTDMLSGECASFTNAFVLFADSVTYERSDCIETVTETLSGGSGYYISLGKLTEIRWEADSNGRLSFKNLSGENLYVNKGNSYVGYFKASSAKSVTFE